jgi:hypothetical protein
MKHWIAMLAKHVAQ